MIEPWDSAWLQEAPSRLGEMTFQCSGGDRSGRETLSLAVDSVRIKTEGDGDRCAQKPPGALSWTWVLTASPVSLHLGPTGVCGFGGPYGETVATGAYRAFRVATAAGHCGAFSGTDGSRTSKSQGGNYAMPPPRASARQQLPHSSGSSSSSTVLTLVPHPFHEAPALAFVSVPLPAPVWLKENDFFLTTLYFNMSFSSSSLLQLPWLYHIPTLMGFGIALFYSHIFIFSSKLLVYYFC